jgi:hypothetical protein
MGAVVELKAKDESGVGLVDRWKLLQKIIADPTPKHADITVAGLLLDMCGCKGRAWPSVTTIAQRTNQTPRNVSRCLERLGRYFQVTKSPGPGRPQTYRPVFDAEGMTSVSPLPTKRDDTQVMEGMSSVSKRGDTGVTLISEEEPVEENQGGSSLRSERAREDRQDDLFFSGSAGEVKPIRRKQKTATSEELETYQPDQSMIDWAARVVPAVDPLAPAVLERWRNHHLGKGTIIRDLNASYRTWLLREPEFASYRPKAAGGFVPKSERRSPDLEAIGRLRAAREEAARRAAVPDHAQIEPLIIDQDGSVAGRA